MNKKQIAITAGLALGLLAVGGAAMARPDGMRGGFAGKMFFRMFADLELTEQQELKAIRMRRSLQEQGQAARVETFKSLEPAIDELGKANPDSAKLHGIADEAVKRFSKIIHSAIDQALELHATLSPEQRTTLVKRAKEIHERREERMEKRFEEKKAPKR
jgi:hypothetical protein